MNDSTAEQEFEQVNAIVRACRSLIVDYGVKGGTAFIQTSNEASLALFTAQQAIIVDLVKGLNTVNVVNKDSLIEDGCAVKTVGEDVNVFLLVKGFVDLDAEIGIFTLTKLNLVINWVKFVKLVKLFIKRHLRLAMKGSKYKLERQMMSNSRRMIKRLKLWRGPLRIFKS